MSPGWHVEYICVLTTSKESQPHPEPQEHPPFIEPQSQSMFNIGGDKLMILY